MTLLLLLLMFLCVNGSGRLKGSKEGEIESSSLSSQKFPSVGPFFMIPRNSGGFEIGSAIGEKETDSFSLSSDLKFFPFSWCFFSASLSSSLRSHTTHFRIFRYNLSGVQVFAHPFPLLTFLLRKFLSTFKEEFGKLPSSTEGKKTFKKL